MGSYHQGQENVKIPYEEYEGLKFYHQSKRPIIKPSRLRKFINLSSGQAFRESDRISTFQSLSGLEMYKFSAVTPVIK